MVTLIIHTLARTYGMVVFKEQISNYQFFTNKIQKSSNFNIASNFLVRLKPQNMIEFAFILVVSPASKYHTSHTLIVPFFTRSSHHWKSLLLAISFVIFKHFIRIIKTRPNLKLINFFHLFFIISFKISLL